MSRRRIPLSRGEATILVGVPAVYRVLGFDGEVLYIGATQAIDQRLAGHRAKTWWPDVWAVEVTYFHDLADALSVEHRLIRHEHPRHNVRDSERRT